MESVVINAQMMSVIKEMLFGSNTTGANLTPIIDDLCGPDDNRDELAVRVLLAYKGKSITPDKPIRYTMARGKNGGVVVMMVTFVTYSMILDTAVVQVSVAKTAKDGSIGDFENPRQITLPLNVFESLEDSLPDHDEVLDYAKQFKKDNE